jgi:nitrogen regulatory protein P-II 1
MVLINVSRLNYERSLIMIKVEAIVREDKLEEVKDVLQELKVHGMTISQVVGCGTALAHTQIVRGSKVDITVVPKVKFEIVLSDQCWADKTVDAISRVAYTGEHGDGKIFVYPLMDVIRIRTGEHGPQAVWDAEQMLEKE